MLLTLGAEAVFAAEPGDLSLLHVLFYSHSGGSFQRLIDTTGGAQQDRFVGGSALIAERLAAALGGVVRLEAPVSRIEVRGDKVTATTPAGQFEGRQVIVTVPPLLAGRIEYEPAPARLARAADPAHADGLGHQVPGASTTSRSGAGTACAARRPVTARARGWSSTTRRRMARRACCWRSWKATRRGGWAASRWRSGARLSSTR